MLGVVWFIEGLKTNLDKKERKKQTNKQTKNKKPREICKGKDSAGIDGKNLSRPKCLKDPFLLIAYSVKLLVARRP